ncbi:MAG: DUF6519 domain-containing protein [Terracidiphilus sp.]
MRGDFSRIRFNPAKHYTAVLEQQGRVSLDADGNERTAIEAWLRDTTNLDVIGPYGGPIGDAGFAITVQGGEVLIQPGRYYVQGLLVENEALQHYNEQPHLIDPAYTAQQLLEAVLEGEGRVTAQLMLQVWQRLVTQLDDGCLREPALGQADTTARLQTVWRVVGKLQTDDPNAGSGRNLIPLIDRIAPVQSASSGANAYADPVSQLSPCCQSLYGSPRILRTGAMGAAAGQGNNECGCQPIAPAGYQGLENQLYRVEIHTPGTLDTATFKWSRENASVVTSVTGISGPVVTATSLGPDANLGFQPGRWVELSDDTYLFGDTPNQPGQLYQIASLGPGPLQVTLAAAVTGVDTARNARMRRWEQSGSGATAQGVSLSALPIPLENGIEVNFRKGNYQSGDYWTIPARTADGQIDWPPCGGNGQHFQPGQFVRIYTAPLACIHRRLDNLNESARAFNPTSRFLVDDCRLQFPPLTALTQEQAPPALHIQSTSWTNDDVMTVDTLLANGLSITFDQAPACPWSGANFSVVLESPLANDTAGLYTEAYMEMFAAGQAASGTDVFLRTVLALDPPTGITVSGAQVNWLMPSSATGSTRKSILWLFNMLNALLFATNPRGWGRMRVRLDGGAVYSNAANGTIYLDGQSFGSTATRAADGAESISLQAPSGNAVKVSDFEGWFYLAPTVVIASVEIQGVEDGNPQPLSAVTVKVNIRGVMTGLQTSSGNATIAVSSVQALITLTYAPIADTTVTLTLSGTGVGTVVTVPATATIPAGQISAPVPINIQASPGAGVKDTITVDASVATALGNFSFNPPSGSQPPTLAITGGALLHRKTP